MKVAWDDGILGVGQIPCGSVVSRVVNCSAVFILSGGIGIFLIPASLDLIPI